MINKIINGLFSLIWGFVGVFTTPISNWLSSVSPDMASLFTSVNNFLNNLADVIAWFIYLIPRPLGVSALALFLFVVINSQSLIIIFKINSWVIDLIKRVWIFGGK